METQKCTKCAETKPVAEFRFQNKAKNIRHRWCKVCFSLHEKQTWKSSAKHRGKRLAETKIRYERNRRFFQEYLAGKSCIACGESDHRVLEFDHRDPETKKTTISAMASGTYSIQTIIDEIEKCDILCANCHRRRTFEQFGYRAEWA